MTQSFTATISQEGQWYVAQCREVDVASQGETEASALQNLREALKLHFAPPRATILPEVRHIEVDLDAA